MARPRAAVLLVQLLAVAPLWAQEGVTAVVTGAVENIYLRPDETSPVDDQAVLGDRLRVQEGTAGFARVSTASGSSGWIPERAIRRDPGEDAAPLALVRSPLAHLYATPSFTRERPLLTAPLGARLGVLRSFGANGHEWVEARLPDGRHGFVARTDLELPEPGAARPLKGPAAWIELGLRFLGAPYTWGGTTPLGFDCSGVVWRIFEQHGVLLMRNSAEMCFRDKHLVPVAFGELQPGDLLFFGSADKIDHMGMWLGDGKLLQATAYGIPSTQVTEFAMSDRLKGRYRYARRLDGQPGARKPGPLPAAGLAALENALRTLAAEGGASYGVYFKDLAGGGTVRVGADRVMHAASTMKTPVLLELLRRVDAGTLRLEDELPVRNEFRSVVDGSAFSIALDPETDGPTQARLGKSASLEFLAREMIVRSSNLATNILLSQLGPESVQRFTDALGARSVKVRRCVEDGKAYERGLNNETDAAGMGIVLEAAVRSPRLSPAAREKAWEILAGQVFKQQIPAGIPEQAGAVVAHKTGSISSVQHDGGVVRLPDGREYVLVLLANDFGADEAGRQRVIEQTRKMSRAVWDAMIAPY